MNCQELNEITDSYLSDELLVETNHDVLRHLENCANCREELAAHRALRTRLRSAVKSSSEMQIDAAFRTRLRESLRETALRPTLWERVKFSELFNIKSLAVAAVCLLVISGFGLLWLTREKSGETAAANLPSNTSNIVIQPSAETPLPQAALAAWQETTEKAVGDHKNCAIKFRLAEKPISLDQAAERYGKFNKNLDQSVMASFSSATAEKPISGIEMLDAHSCLFQGRRFAHIVLRYRKSVVSVLVSEPEFSDSSDQTINSQAQGTIRVASFHAGHHAVFVVSDLSESDNLAIAGFIKPFITRHIEQTEA